MNPGFEDVLTLLVESATQDLHLGQKRVSAEGPDPDGAAPDL